MSTWIEPAELLTLVAGLDVRGDESPQQAIMRDPTTLLPVSEPALPPLDVATYEVRRRRFRDGEGPKLTGIDEFIDGLTSLAAPGRAVTVTGEWTTYTYVLDESLSRAICGVAIDPPSEDAGGKGASK